MTGTARARRPRATPPRGDRQAAGGERAAGSVVDGARPACRSSGRRTSRARPGDSRPGCGPRVSASRAFCPRGLERHAGRDRTADPRPARRTSSSTASQRPGHRLHASCTTSCSSRCASTSRRPCSQYLQAYLLAGVVQRAMFRLRTDVEDKLNRMPLRYVDRQPRGDLLEPRHQRHRQPRAEPAADAEPAAHVVAHAGRRR